MPNVVDDLHLIYEFRIPLKSVISDSLHSDLAAVSEGTLIHSPETVMPNGAEIPRYYLDFLYVKPHYTSAGLHGAIQEASAPLHEILVLFVALHLRPQIVTELKTTEQDEPNDSTCKTVEEIPSATPGCPRTYSKMEISLPRKSLSRESRKSDFCMVLQAKKIVAAFHR